MNKDKIKKLIRLANANPNDHEANLAARMVCKMLKDYSFEEVKTAFGKMNEPWVSRPAPPKQEAPKPPPPPKWEPDKPKPGYYQSKQGHYWDDVVSDEDTSFEDMVKEMFNKSQNFRGGKTYGTPPIDWSDKEAWQQNNDKRKLKCIKCKEEKETRFRGLPEIWVCMECRGKEYQKW